MNRKRWIVLGILIFAIAVIGKLLFIGLKSIKIDDFHPAAIIFVIDSSASNQGKIEEEIKYLKSMCSILDPEDKIKILKVSQKSYLIYEGAPSETTTINDSLKEFTKYNSSEYGTAYGEALKKAFDYALTMKKTGYVPSVVVIGDLENEGDVTKQIDWNTLPQNVENVKKYIPEISMMFVYAHPEKLDLVKTKLSPVLSEDKLILINEQTTNKSQRKLLEAIGR